MSINGSLESFYLSSLLQLLCNDRKTGILRLHDDHHEVTVVIKDGTIVNASSTVQEDQLGYLLRSEGVITSDTLAASLKTSRLFNKKLGKVLIEQGIITPEKLQQYLRMQVEHIIYSVFLWQKGTFDYEDAPVDVDELSKIELDTMEVVLEASRRVDEMSVLRRQVPAEPEVVRLSDRINVSDMRCLNPNEQAVLDLIDNRRTIQQIILESGYDTFTVYKSLYALISAGFVIADQQHAPRGEESLPSPSLKLESRAVHDDHAVIEKRGPAEQGADEKPVAEKPHRAAMRMSAKSRRTMLLVLLCICIAATIGFFFVYRSFDRQPATPPQQKAPALTASKPAAAPAKQPLQKMETTTVAPSGQQPEPQTSHAASDGTTPYQDPHQFFFIALPSGFVLQDRSSAQETEVLFSYPPNISITVTARRAPGTWDTNTEMYQAIAGAQQSRDGLSQVQIQTYGPSELGGGRGYVFSGTALHSSAFCRLQEYGVHAYHKTVRIKIICKNCRNPRLAALLDNITESLHKTLLIYP